MLKKNIILLVLFFIVGFYYLNKISYGSFHLNYYTFIIMCLLFLTIITSIFISLYTKLLCEKETDSTQLNNIELLKANEIYRKEFLGDISHELKTPIFNIQGYVSTLIDGGLDDKKINKKYLYRAEQNISRLISIVEDLETISKLEEGKLKLNFTNFDIISLIDDIFELTEINAQKKFILLKLIKSKKHYIVHADKDKILEVINNLVSNSINYGIKDGVTEVRVYELDKDIVIEVADNGIGIDKKYINRIFERFFRVDKSRSKKLGGTGLGLSIVKHIIEGHNSSIKVISELNKGTVFKFSLKKTKNET